MSNIAFDALAFRQPTSNAPGWGSRNGQDHLAFDASVDETADVRGVMPRQYAGGGVTVVIHWRATSATSGDVVWTAAFERQADGGQDTDSDGFASAQSATVAAPGTAGMLDYASIAFTDGAQMDSVVAGDVFRLRITRDADNGSDTMTGDAELVSVEIRETA